MTSTIQISFQYELYSLVSCTNIVHTLPILQDKKKKTNHIQNNISNITQKKKHILLSVILKSIWSFFPTFIYHGLHTESVLPDGAPGETAAGKGTGVLTLLA